MPEPENRNAPMEPNRYSLLLADLYRQWNIPVLPVDQWQIGKSIRALEIPAYLETMQWQRLFRAHYGPRRITYWPNPATLRSVVARRAQRNPPSDPLT